MTETMWGLAVFAVIQLIAGGLMAIAPFLSSKALLLGVHVPAEARRDQEARNIRTRYALLAALTVAAVTGGGFGIGLTGESAFAAAAAAGPLLQVLLLFLLFQWSRKQMKALKARRGWVTDAPVKRQASLDFHKRRKTIADGWFLVHLVVIAVCAAAAVVGWDRIPDVIATHYGIDGKADGYADKTVWNVFLLNFIQLLMTGLFLFVNATIRMAKQQLDPDRPEASLRKDLRYRYVSSVVLYALSLVIVLFFGVIQGFMLYGWEMRLLPALSAGIPILLLAGVVGFIVYVRRSGDSFPGDPATLEDSYWKAGVFYYNPDDPALFVAKRYGIGWTFNFARPAAWLVLALILLLPLGAAAGSMIAGR